MTGAAAVVPATRCHNAVNDSRPRVASTSSDSAACSACRSRSRAPGGSCRPPPCPYQQRHHIAPGHHVVQQGDVPRLERLHLQVAFEDRRHVIDGGGRRRQELGHGHRRFQDQRCVQDVAEVEHTGHVMGFADEHVAAMPVAVDGLAAQASQCRKGQAHRRRRVFDPAPQIGHVDEGSEVEQLRQAAHVPGDGLGQRGMCETLQRPVDACQRSADGAQQRMIGSRIPQHLAGQVGGEQGGIAQVALDHLPQVRALLRRQHRRNRQGRILFGQVPQHVDLALRRGGGRTQNFQYVIAPGGSGSKITVPFAGQGPHRHRQAILVARYSFGFRRAENRGRAPQG